MDNVKFIYVLISGLCGFFVGLSELLSRYKTFVNVFSNYMSFIYMGINFTMSVAVYLIIKIYDIQLGSLGSREIGVSIFAGFGAMAFLRSSFFNVKNSNDKVIEIGPAYVLVIFLKSAERQFIQTLSKRNITKITSLMKGLPFLNASKELPLIILTSLSVFSADEQESLSGEILDLVNNQGSNEEVKNIALGTILERYAGIEFLESAVSSLKGIYAEQKAQKDKLDSMLKTLLDMKARLGPES